jgi:hypothetical protein
MVTGQAGPIWKVPIMGEGMNLADLSWDPGGVVMETHLQADNGSTAPATERYQCLFENMRDNMRAVEVAGYALYARAT